MNTDDMLNSPALKKAAVTFATGYARRMMEGQYTRLMETELGKRAAQLTRPSKYAVEVVLNGIVAYLSTKESTLANTPVKEFLWEIAKDAPSEISKRLLNGDHKFASTAATPDVETGDGDSRTVLDGLLRMDADDLGTFLSWLEKATPEERSQMAESMAKLTEDEQRKLMTLQSEQGRTLLATSPKSVRSQKTRPPEVQADLDAAHRRLDEQLRQLRGKAEE